MNWKERSNDLDQQLKVALRQQELKDQDAADKAKTAPTVSAAPTGFDIQSADGNYRLRIGADLQVDDRTFTGPGAALGSDAILLRRVRPTFSGTVYKYVDYFFRPDFGQGTTIIYDAYLELKYFSRAKVRVGKFKPPEGLERLQSDDDTSFIERGLPTLLVPSRDIGYQVSGDIVSRRVNYAVGVFNGVPDNSLSDSAVSSHRDYTARLFFTPFQPESKSLLSGLGFGAGVGGGGIDGIALPTYKTFGQATFISFASGVVSAGHRNRFAPQLTYYLGPFGLLGEYTLTEEGFRKGTLQRVVAFRAWQGEASYILTGEKKGFTSPTPNKPFDPHAHGWGAVELALRVGDFTAQRSIYDYGFVSPATSPRHSHEWVGGVNWYLNRLVRISVDYGNTQFSGAMPSAVRAPERVLLTRFQINFI